MTHSFVYFGASVFIDDQLINIWDTESHFKKPGSINKFLDYLVSEGFVHCKGIQLNVYKRKKV